MRLLESVMVSQWMDMWEDQQQAILTATQQMETKTGNEEKMFLLADGQRILDQLHCQSQMNDKWWMAAWMANVGLIS